MERTRREQEERKRATNDFMAGVEPSWRRWKPRRKHLCLLNGRSSWARCPSRARRARVRRARATLQK